MTPDAAAGSAGTAPSALVSGTGLASDLIADLYRMHAVGLVRIALLLVGMPVSQATAVLHAAGLRATIIEQAGSGVPPGIVTTQTPAGGTRAAVGATVVLTVRTPVSSATPAPGEPTRLVSVASFAVTIAIPQSWQPMDYLGPMVGYRGADGWVQVSRTAWPAGLRTACTAVATGTASRPYGSHPQISYLGIDGRPGCLIVPSGDAPVASRPAGGPGLPKCSALVEYRQPVSGYNLLVISTDPAHLLTIAGSIQLHH